jgi:hypothetical protein
VTDLGIQLEIRSAPNVKHISKAGTSIDCYAKLGGILGNDRGLTTTWG